MKYPAILLAPTLFYLLALHAGSRFQPGKQRETAATARSLGRDLRVTPDCKALLSGDHMVAAKLALYSNRGKAGVSPIIGTEGR